jgi:hypothetical protein
MQLEGNILVAAAAAAVEVDHLNEPLLRNCTELIIVMILEQLLFLLLLNNNNCCSSPCQ